MNDTSPRHRELFTERRGEIEISGPNGSEPFRNRRNFRKPLSNSLILKPIKLVFKAFGLQTLENQIKLHRIIRLCVISMNDCSRNDYEIKQLTDRNYGLENYFFISYESFSKNRISNERPKRCLSISIPAAGTKV